MAASASRIADAAAGDEQGLARRLQQLRGARDLAFVRPGAADVVDARLEERFRIVEGEFLRVLAEPEEGRPAIGRIEHGGDRLRQ